MSNMKTIRPKEMRGGVVPGPKYVTLVTCGEPENANIITVSYTCQSSDHLVWVSIRPYRYSNGIITAHRKFGMNYVDKHHLLEADYCGIVSGRDINKFEVTGFTKEVHKSRIPLIKETPLSHECEVEQILTIGDHDVFIGRVLYSRERRKDEGWLYHNDFDYFVNGKPMGKLFETGKKLLKRK